MIGRDILLEVLEALEADPSLAERARKALGLANAAPPATAEVLYAKIPDFAKRLGISRSSAFGLVNRGLPCVGSHRARRVDVRRAEQWLRDQHSHVDDAVERSARRAARKAVGR